VRVRCVTLLVTRVPFRFPIPETDGYDDVLYRLAVWYIGPVIRGKQTTRGLTSAYDSSCNIVAIRT